MPLQPLLHDLVTCLRAPSTVLSARDGQIRPDGAQGAFTADVRVLSTAVLTVAGREPEPLYAELVGASGARFVSVARGLVDRGHDPGVRVIRSRQAVPAGLGEHIALANDGEQDLETTLSLDLAGDLAGMAQVKDGALGSSAMAAVEDGALVWRAEAGLDVRIRADQQAALSASGIRWQVSLPAGSSTTVQWSLEVADPAAVVAGAPDRVPWREPVVSLAAPALPRLVERSLADLDALRLVTTALPHAQFVAAGSPWFLTLFGRDSLLAARLTLSLGTELAEGTLATLAARQGVRVDAGSAQAPGKMLHELRRAPLRLSGGNQARALTLPPVYYGSIDATALWVILLHDAWRHGMAADRVERLLPALLLALAWVTTGSDPDGDGFAEYVDRTGSGLANQGWKDSGDSVRFRDGRIAAPPIALAEVQGYAYEAAIDGAALLDAFGRDGSDRLRAWAGVLAERFRARFWVEDEIGPYPALALDGAKRPVDARASNMGHLLGTGLLDRHEAAAVASRLAAPDMDSGFGLRTMSAQDGGYAPLSYHCGAVWPHDTALVAAGLAREGFGEQAARLLQGLVDAAPSFDYRLPELYSGDARESLTVMPYPAACRPQAWAAAAGVSALSTLLGLAPDVPRGVVRLRPAPRPGHGPLTVRGLTVGGSSLDVTVDDAGSVTAASIGRPDLSIG